MTYEIRNYKEEYLEKQYEIGNSFLKDWPGTGMTSVDNLKQLYSREGFDPKTKLYAFRDDEMVGYMTSTIKPLKEGETVQRANMEFPIVLEGNEEAEQLLYEKMITNLKKKAVQRVQSRVHPKWGKTTQWAKKYMYTKKRTLSTVAIIDVDFQIHSDILPAGKYEESDLEAVKKMYIDNGILNEQQIDNQLKFLNENPDRVVDWHLYREGDEILGNSIMTKGDDKTAVMANISAFGEHSDRIRAGILKRNLESCKEQGIESLELYLFGKYLALKPEYEKLGLKFEEGLDLYHRDI